MWWIYAQYVADNVTDNVANMWPLCGGYVAETWPICS